MAQKKSPRTEVDWLLEVLVRVVNESQEDGPSITLAVGGMLVSGQMVTAERYYKALLPLAEKEIADALKGMRDTDANFVHLAKAQFFLSGGNAPPIPTSGEHPEFFRAKVSAVDGYTPGRLGVSES